MRAPQHRARPRSTSHDSTGTLSYQAIGFPQMQCEPGETMLSSRGTRTMTTFKKLPTKRPSRIAVVRINQGGTSATSTARGFHTKTRTQEDSFFSCEGARARYDARRDVEHVRGTATRRPVSSREDRLHPRPRVELAGDARST